MDSKDFSVSTQFCFLGRVSHEVGWKYRDVIKRLERRRIIKKAVKVHHDKKMTALQLKAIKMAKKPLAPFEEKKASYGY